MKTKDPSRARDEQTHETAPKAQAENQQVKDADSGAPLERRLRALVEAEQGAFEQQRAEAERRLKEAEGLIEEAQAESERERAHVAELERKLAMHSASGAQSSEELVKSQAELELTRKQLEQAHAGLETYEAAREKLEATQRKLEVARAEIHRKGDELAAAERRATLAREEAQETMRSQLESDNALEAVKSEAGARESELRTQVEQELRERIQIERSLGRTDAELKTLTERFEKASAEVGELEERLEETTARAEHEREQRSADAERAAQNRKALEERIKGLAQHDEDARNALEQAQAQLSARESQLQETRQQVAELQRTVTEANAEIVRTRDRISSEAERHRIEKTEASRRISDLAEREEAAKEMIERLTAESERYASNANESERLLSAAHESASHDREARLAADRKIEELTVEATRREREVALVEQRIAEALDRRLKATIEGEAQARVLLDRHGKDARLRAAELADLEQRIDEARGLLGEIQAAGFDELNRSDEVLNRLEAVIEVDEEASQAEQADAAKNGVAPAKS